MVHVLLLVFSRLLQTLTYVCNATTRCRNFPLLYTIQAGADINTPSEVDGNTPLMTAAMYGDIDAIEELVEHGADTDMHNDAGDDAATILQREYGEDLSAIIAAHHGTKRSANKAASRPPPPPPGGKKSKKHKKHKAPPPPKGGKGMVRKYSLFSGVVRESRCLPLASMYSLPFSPGSTAAAAAGREVEEEKEPGQRWPRKI